MKKIFGILTFVCLFVCAGCMDHLDDVRDYETLTVRVKLSYPPQSTYGARAGVTVKMTNSANNAVFEAQTDDEGVATFHIVSGLYAASVSDKRIAEGVITLFNGMLANTKLSAVNAGEPLVIDLQASTLSQLVIKEFYFGGCPTNDGAKNFFYDKYVILYNNSEMDAPLENVCLAMTYPYGSTGANYDIVDGKLLYDLGDDSWMPAAAAFWTFGPTSAVVAPGGQVVVAFNSANKNTATYFNSVDLDDPSYYVTYDPSNYDNASYHPAPSSNIPTSHYLSIPLKIGLGNAWALSNTSPGFFVFAPPSGTDLVAFAQNPDNQDLYHNQKAGARFKIPLKWVLDGVEVFQAAKTNNKRLLATVDAGSVALKNAMGYTVYRNVDVEATEAIEGNAGKLVYGYSYGTADLAEGSTDPSDIDAEASIRNGARIIYKDSNNSTEDFHMRRQASLRK